MYLPLLYLLSTITVGYRTSPSSPPWYVDVLEKRRLSMLNQTDVVSQHHPPPSVDSSFSSFSFASNPTFLSPTPPSPRLLIIHSLYPPSYSSSYEKFTNHLLPFIPHDLPEDLNGPELLSIPKILELTLRISNITSIIDPTSSTISILTSPQLLKYTSTYLQSHIKALKDLNLDTYVSKSPRLLTANPSTLEGNLKHFKKNYIPLSPSILKHLHLKSLPELIKSRTDDWTLEFPNIKPPSIPYPLNEDLSALLEIDEKVYKGIDDSTLIDSGISKVVKKLPGVVKVKNLKERVGKLKELGLGKDLIMYNSEGLERKIELFKSGSLGFKFTDQCIKSNPRILSLSCENIEVKIEYLEEIFDDPIKVLNSKPSLITLSLNKLKKNVEGLQYIFPVGYKRMIKNNPHLLASNVINSYQKMLQHESSFAWSINYENYRDFLEDNPRLFGADLRKWKKKVRKMEEYCSRSLEGVSVRCTNLGLIGWGRISRLRYFEKFWGRLADEEEVRRLVFLTGKEVEFWGRNTTKLKVLGGEGREGRRREYENLEEWKSRVSKKPEGNVGSGGYRGYLCRFILPDWKSSNDKLKILTINQLEKLTGNIIESNTNLGLETIPLNEINNDNSGDNLLRKVVNDINILDVRARKDEALARREFVNSLSLNFRKILPEVNVFEVAEENGLGVFLMNEEELGRKILFLRRLFGHDISLSDLFLDNIDIINKEPAQIAEKFVSVLDALSGLSYKEVAKVAVKNGGILVDEEEWGEVVEYVVNCFEGEERERVWEVFKEGWFWEGGRRGLSRLEYFRSCGGEEVVCDVGEEFERVELKVGYLEIILGSGELMRERNPGYESWLEEKVGKDTFKEMEERMSKGLI